MIARRGLITGLAGILAVGYAPAIVRASSIMVPARRAFQAPGYQINQWGGDDMEKILRILHQKVILDYQGLVIADA
jgi:hypothetical protein